jgi:hypothetical protein
MSLTLEDLEDLANENNDRDPIRVGELPSHVAEVLNLKNHNVYLSRSSLLHIQDGHPDITHFDLLNLPFAIDRGLLVQEIERPHMIIALYLNAISEIRFTIALKISQNGTEIWVSSFYRTKARQTKSILRRGRLLQKHK